MWKHSFDETERTFAVASWEVGQLTNFVLQRGGIPKVKNASLTLFVFTKQGRVANEILLGEYNCVLEEPVTGKVFSNYLVLSNPVPVTLKIPKHGSLTGNTVVYKFRDEEIVDVWSMSGTAPNGVILGQCGGRTWGAINYTGTLSIYHQQVSQVVGKPNQYQTVLYNFDTFEEILSFKGDAHVCVSLIPTEDRGCILFGQYRTALSCHQKQLQTHGIVSSWKARITYDGYCEELSEIVSVASQQRFAVTTVIQKEDHTYLAGRADGLLKLDNNRQFKNELFFCRMNDSGSILKCICFSGKQVQLISSIRGVIVGISFKGDLVRDGEVILTGSGVDDFHVQEYTDSFEPTSIKQTVMCVDHKTNYLHCRCIACTKHSFNDCYGVIQKF